MSLCFHYVGFGIALKYIGFLMILLTLLSTMPIFEFCIVAFFIYALFSMLLRVIVGEELFVPFFGFVLVLFLLTARYRSQRVNYMGHRSWLVTIFTILCAFDLIYLLIEFFSGAYTVGRTFRYGPLIDSTVAFAITYGMFFGVLWGIRTEREAMKIFRIAFVFVVFESIFAVVQLIAPKTIDWLTLFGGPATSIASSRNYFGYLIPTVSRNVRLPQGTTGNHVLLGNFLVLFLPLSFTLTSSRVVPKRRLFYFAQFVGFVGLIISFSRQNLIGLVVAIFSMLVLSKVRYRWARQFMLVSFVLIVLTFSFFSPIKAAFSKYVDEAGENLFARIAQWGRGVEFATKDVGVFFRGIGSSVNPTTRVPTLDPSFGLSIFDANSYISIWIKKGMIGLTIYLVFIGTLLKKQVYVFRNARSQVLRDISIGLFGGCIAYLVAMFFDNKLSLISFPNMFLFMFAGLTVCMERMLRKEVP